MAIFKQNSTATSGTVTVQDTKQDVVLIHNAASLAATLTITFPPNPIDGQKLTIATALGVTLLTLTSSLTIVGDTTSMAAASYATWLYDIASTKWFRIG